MHKAFLEEQWFASVDGETFLPISREPDAEDESTVIELLADSPAQARTTRGMRWHRSFLERRGAEISEVVAA